MWELSVLGACDMLGVGPSVPAGAVLLFTPQSFPAPLSSMRTLRFREASETMR